MPVRPSARRPFAASLLAAAAAGTAFGHADDPKLRDRMPPVVAPAWRAATDGPASARAGAPPFPAAHVRLEAWLPIGEFSATASTGADCWGYAAPSGREYAIMTVSDAVGFVEVTDPANPQVVATFTQPPSLWHDVKTFGAHAYAVTEGGGGIRVFDLSRIDVGIVGDLGTVTEGGDLRTHNLAVDETAGMLYRCGGGPNGGLRIYSLADPAAPAFVGEWTFRYVHDAQVRTCDAGPFAGRTLAFCAGGFNGGSVETGLTILDVTDPANVVEYATLQYASGAYAHQCWLNDDGTLLYLGDEVDELQLGVPTLTRVIDVANPLAPTVVGVFGNDRDAVDHNQYVVGDRLYQANYRTGLRIWDLSADAVDPVEIGFFDTFPESDGIAFNGAWSVYPFLPSGTLLVSDLERGLFVLTEAPSPLRIAADGPLPGPLAPPAGVPISVTVAAVDGAALDPASVRLVVRVEDGAAVEIAMSETAPGRFTGLLPSGACGDRVVYHVRAAATDGREATFPLGAPLETYALETTYGDGTAVGFADDAESNLGWTFGLPGDTALTGIWERGVPSGDYPGEPEEDHTPDPGVACFVTGNSGGANPFLFVRDGFTTMVSPAFDATVGPGATLRYAWWLVGQPDLTTLELALSNDDGATWTEARTFVATSSGTWRVDEIRIADVIEPSAAMRLRVRCTAEAFGEAALDDVELVTVVCTEGCGGDLDGDGGVGFPDLLALLADWGPCADCAADLDGDGTVGFADLLAILGAWGPC